MAGDNAIALAAWCTIGASAIAIWHIYMHLCNYTEPTYQRYIIRIIFMVHVYALMSFLALVAPLEAIFFNSICGIYEAWVIYNFMSLCLAWVGGPGVVTTNLQGRFLKPSWHLMTCCCDAIALDGIFIRRCKQGVLQFVIIRPFLVFATLVLYGINMYTDGRFSTTDAYLYITIVYTFSYTGALAALILFYFACKDLLRPFNPLPKFLLIKSVVFLTYWQGVLIALLANWNLLKAQNAAAVQNIVICVEMQLAAVAHLYAFPYSTYADANVGSQGGLVHAIRHALNFSDVVQDAMHQFAPTYHEYVLYSDGSQEAPQHYRVRTFVPTNQEMERPGNVRNSQPSLDNSTFERESPQASVEKETVERMNPPSYGQIFGQFYNSTPFGPRDSQHSEGGPDSKQPVDRGKRLLEELNPQKIPPTSESRQTPLFDLYTQPRVLQFEYAKSKGINEEKPSQSTSTQRFSLWEEEVNEMTKLTNRRVSENGTFVDTIDIRGENDEYSEGFIQR